MKKEIKSQKQAQSNVRWWMIAVMLVLALVAVGVVFRNSIPGMAAPTPTPSETSRLPANTIEQAGFVEVIQMPDVRSVYLFAEPNPNSEKIAELEPGQRGELLGQDLSGEWLYVRFGENTGWTPIYFFIVTAVQ
ncbi:MAG: hypothetical protein N2117_00565 [Anaerolineales bacterium]|nr:hypothetical protein [Anaerolineales bacterium]MCX7753722.1 hypothetical protein [Anaerolineales bacterium]MDW8276490.1 hypothetical protein [Anaerolineales bacterium]